MSKDEEFNDWLCEREDGIGYSSFNKKETADEIFEKLGYEKLEDKYNINYIKIYSFINGDKVREQIKFCKLDKYVHIENFNYDSGVIFGKFLGMGELQAINKKCQELEWV